MKNVVRCEITRNLDIPFIVLERFSDFGLTRRFVKECELLMQQEANSSWSLDRYEHWVCHFYVDDKLIFRLIYNVDWSLPFSGEFLYSVPSKYIKNTFLCYPHRIHTYVDINNF